MKLLIIGSDKVYSIENFYFKYFNELGIDVTRFNAQAIFYDYYFGSNILTKVLFKLGASNIIPKINNQFKQIVNEIKPEIIWVFKGMEISPKSLKWAKLKGIKLVNYNPDNPFVFSGTGSGNKNVTKSIDLYDFHFTYNLEIKKKLEQQHRAKTGLLPFAFDISEQLYEKCAQEKEVVKVCFLGNPDKTRSNFIESIAAQGIEIDVYGHDWNKFVKHQNIGIHQPVYGDNQYRILRQYRVQLNLMRKHNLNSHNMRSFEIPGIGGIQLAPQTTEHELFFEPSKEIFLYQSVADCVKKINYLVQLTVQEANEFRLAARLACVEKKYSYTDRATQVISVLKSL
jgi:spore maturation protein CgeB